MISLMLTLLRPLNCDIEISGIADFQIVNY